MQGTKSATFQSLDLTRGNFLIVTLMDIVNPAIREKYGFKNRLDSELKALLRTIGPSGFSREEQKLQFSEPVGLP